MERPLSPPSPACPRLAPPLDPGGGRAPFRLGMADAPDPASLDLAEGFPHATRDQWLALVDRSLKGAPRSRLATLLADGIEVLPLYAGEDADAPAPRPPLAPHDPVRPWEVRALVAHPDPARANAQALQDLEGGAASVLVRFDPSGRLGLAEPSPGVLSRVLDGVLTDLAPVALDAGAQGVEAAEALSAASGRGPAAPLAFHMDPIGAAALGALPVASLEAEVARAARAGARLGGVHPRASLVRAAGEAVHEAGGTEAQELGFAAACGLAYARALNAAGLPRAAAFGAVVLGLAAEPRMFVTVAKLRAARLIWARLAGACDAPPLARIEARGALRTLSTLDPWTNLLRLTASAFGAAVGGADAVVIPPFTAPLTEGGASTATDFARRQARNTQLVLMEEAHLGRVADPAAGSGLVERLTDAFARAGWAQLQAIEAQGGAAAALADGRFAAEVAQARARLDAATATRESGLIGVSEFANLAEGGVEVEPLAPLAADARAPAVHAPLPAHRVAHPYERLRQAASAQRRPPRAYLAQLGPAAEFAARTGWVRNLLATGGIVADAGPLDDYSPERTPLAVLCGADARYAEQAQAAVAGLKAAGARAVWLAGRPGALEPALTAAGLNGALFAGCDALAVLHTLQEAAR